MMPPQTMKDRIIVGTKKSGVSRGEPGRTVMGDDGQTMAARIAQARATALDFQKNTAAHPTPLSSKKTVATAAVLMANLAGVFISFLIQNVADQARLFAVACIRLVR